MYGTTAAARQLRQHSTLAERLLWQHLRAHRLAGYSFQRQQPLGPYVVDFACLKRRLVIEVDGSSHESKVEYDWIRTSGGIRTPVTAGFQGISRQAKSSCRAVFRAR